MPAAIIHPDDMPLHLLVREKIAAQVIFRRAVPGILLAMNQ
jgi:hypothetical protein